MVEHALGFSDIPPSKFYWSATKVNIANFCTMRYYIIYGLHEKSLRLSAYVFGSELHNLIENFWKRLGSPDEVISTSKKFKDKKYFDQESFSKYLEGRWKRTIIADKHAKNKITWNNKAQPWTLLDKLRKLSFPLYDYLINKPKPLFAEFPFDFIADNKRFKGRIDEIRLEGDKIIIRDYKSGNPWVGEMKLKHDPQLTLYNAGLCAKLREDRNFARKFNLDGKVEEFMEGRQFVSPNLELEFFMIEALSIDSKKVKYAPNPVNKTRRDDNHFFEILKMVEGIKKSVSQGNVYPEYGQKCDFCDVRFRCDEESKKIGQDYMANKQGNLFLPFALPDYIKKDTEKKRDPNQKRIRFRYKKSSFPSQN